MNHPICVHPDNPHYLSYKGSPILLITSAEHYGAVINKAFDYSTYLDALQSYGLNYTRIYCGAYSEHPGMFGQPAGENSLSPAEADLIVPWARSSETGYKGGGNLFDLDRWDAAYFQRLQDFISAAEKRDIIVEVCLFNCMYPEVWPYCPMNAANNIQGAGKCGYFDVQSILDPQLLEYQIKYVDKITHEVNPFDNVILEIIDEPTLYGADSRVIVNWIKIMADTILHAEKQLGTRHLIAQQLEIGVDFTSDPHIDLITSQYAQYSGTQVGGMMALLSSYRKDKPIELNETAWFPIWYSGDIVAASRIEMWEFVVGGGAGFNQLNGYFTVGNPGGNHATNALVLKQMAAFIQFMNSFDFVKMTQDFPFVRKIGRPDTLHSVLSEKGRQYAAYFHHGVPQNRNNSLYVAMPGAYTEQISVDLPTGSYRVDWVNPQDVAVILSTAIQHSGGELEFESPTYSVDIALSIVNITQ